MRGQGFNSDGEVLSSAFVAHENVDVDFSDSPSLTRQEFADECDINVLMARYEKSGVFAGPVNSMAPQYLDITDTPPLQEALDIMAEASEAFMRLPAVVRREFDNDPLRFVYFAQDRKNVDKLREWGLAEPLPKEPEPSRVIVVPDPAAPAPKAP